MDSATPSTAGRDPYQPPDHNPGTMRLSGLKQRLLSDFSRWLDEIDEHTLLTSLDPPKPLDDAPDLYAFLAELAALRKDSQLQAKQAQSLNQRIDQSMEDMGQRLEDQVSAMERIIGDMRGQLPKARREAQTVIAVEFVEVHEALLRCVQALSDLHIPTFCPGRRKAEIRTRAKTPVELLSAKSDDALTRLGIRPVAAVGDRFDAETMRVIAKESSPDTKALPPGTVTSILSQGYRLQNHLIRTAEVKVAE